MRARPVESEPARPRMTTAAIELAEVRDAAMRLVVSPFWTLLLWTASSVGDGGDVPRATRRDILARLRPRDRAALAPMRPGAARTVPVFAAGTLAPGTHAVRDELERIASTPASAAEAVLEDLVEQPGNDAWRGPADAPRAWSRAFVAALARAWPAIEPAWRASRPRVRREVERAATAASLGAQIELLIGLWPDSRVKDGRFEFPVATGGWPAHPNLHARQLILTPMLGLRPRRLVGYDAGRRPRALRDLTYAIEPPAFGDRATGADAADSLAALIGPARSSILQLLARPRDMGAIADGLQAVRSSATRHVDVLEAAGLVERRSHGRRVLVHLTPRGERLLELYR